VIRTYCHDDSKLMPPLEGSTIEEEGHRWGDDPQMTSTPWLRSQTSSPIRRTPVAAPWRSSDPFGGCRSGTNSTRPGGPAFANQAAAISGMSTPQSCRLGSCAGQGSLPRRVRRRRNPAIAQSSAPGPSEVRSKSYHPAVDRPDGQRTTGEDRSFCINGSWTWGSASGRTT
jgi:hypothetical protein